VLLCRERRSSQSFTSASVNVPVNRLRLKYGFQWLSNQNTHDAIIVDEKANSSVLENLVFE